MSISSNKGFAPVLYGSLLVWASLTAPAAAYGPEGLFGGRLNPDSTVVFDNPVEVLDRPLRAQTVLQHPRPDYDPVPYELGSFEVFPSVEFGLSNDTNIYASQYGNVNDMVFNVRPAVSAFSNWNRHALSTTTYADFNMFEDNDAENYNNFVTDWRGRYDIEAKTWIAGHAGYQYLTTPRSSPDAANGVNPGKFSVYKGGISAFRGRGILGVGLDDEITHFNYDNVKTSVTTLDESGQNRTRNDASARVTYDLTENFKPYVRGAFNTTAYDNSDENDSRGYEAVLGSTMDFGGITSADLYAGWMSQDYFNFAYKPVNDAFKFGGRVEWNVTGLTSVVAEANRTIEETTDTNFNSYLASGGSLTVTHELLRNLILEADGAYTLDDYNGNGMRHDDVYSAGTGARWLINRALYADFVYNWTDRESSVSASNYDRHLVTVRLGVQM